MASQYRGRRFPPENMSHAVCLDHRFTLSFRDVEDLLDERGIMVSSQGIGQECPKFDPATARNLGKNQGGPTISPPGDRKFDHVPIPIDGPP